MRWVIAALAMLPTQTVADTQYWNYGDWSVRVETVDTGEDLRVFCAASTGGDGLPALRIEVSNGDALPPHYYPAPVLHEFAPRGHTTMMQDGQRVLFEFDLDTVSEGFVQAGLDEDGIMQARASVHGGDNLWLLQNMRHAEMLWIKLDDEVVYGASLAGFTASYGKIAEQCGFSTIGVID
ncbi:hypothetical protein DS901_15675 [Loktanella sp. D2R18]|uniref:hypothetical protein n=1 Tax=Rhodobacterales TaxID=204455 RepID=UPI000DE8333D|nr:MULTISPECIES: hypothetical protein [Rhodobacterales]MDO6591099.1 hypothetical protein [Yoonia sp. 1_MG-2023]RBW42151.1 hypothetical protein DS901_15675 [Loktanella sp. D2R18]